MKLLNKDVIFVLVTSAFTCACSYLLVRDIMPDISGGSRRIVGNIVFKKKIAQRKFSEEVVWQGLVQNASVYNFDYIRTDASSSAVIFFRDGTKIELDENSMILINKNDDDSLNIGLEGGNISATKSSESGSLAITSENTAIKITSGGLSVSKSESGIGVDLSSGKAELVSGKSSGQITSEQGATISGSGIEVDSNPLKPVLPENGKFLITQSNQKNVALSWKAPAGAEIQIASDRKFTRVKRTIKATRIASAEATLAPGKYYWRLRLGSKTSVVRYFTVLSDSAPTLALPANASEISMRKKNPLVTFRWNGSNKASVYDVLISSNADMSNPLKKFSVTGKTISTDELGEGNYYWQVKGRYLINADKDAVVSATGTFAVKKSDKGFRPTLIAPLNNSTASVSMAAAGKVPLTWHRVPDAVKYEVVLASDGAFSSVVAKSETASNFMNIPAQIPQGKYYWKVTAIDESGERSEPSMVQIFVVTASAELVNTSPADGSSVESSNVRFTWKDPNLGNRYLLEISESPSFSKLSASEIVLGSSRLVKLDKPSKYFWRVFLVDEAQKKVASSKLTSFTIPSALELPKIISPAQNSALNLNNTNKITLKWTQVAGATEYSVILKYFVAGEEYKIFSAKSTKNEYVFSDFRKIKLGDLVAEIRAIRKTNAGISAISEPASVKFSLVYKSDLAAPVITTPQVIYVK